MGHSKLIFLDIDGVLVNRRSLQQIGGMNAPFAPDCLAALNHITERTGANIVVTSTWRLGMTISRVRGLLKQRGVNGRIVGLTPDLTLVRGTEIETWIEKNGPVKSFVILDDDSDMEPYRDRLVQTKFEAGLTAEDADRAIRILNG